MATRMKTRRMTAADRIVSWALMAGLATVLFQFAAAAALPAHFV